MVQPLNKMAYAPTEKWLLEQATIAANGKMDGLLIEFRGGGILGRDIPPWEIEMMSELTQKVIQLYPQLVIGVEILWHYPGATLQVAKTAKAAFVRIDFFSDAVIADKLTVPIDPQALLKYKKQIAADNVFLLTDIQVKYSKMINSKISISESAAQAEKSGSDGVIVSGAKSGTSPDTERLIQARKNLKSIPIIIGSGFSIDNAATILPHVDAVIVGTSISEKTGGPLLIDKVSALMNFVDSFRKK